MPETSDSANRPLPSILTRSSSWMRIFLHYLSSRLPSFDKCLEKRSKIFSVTGGDEQTTSAVAISFVRSQLAQPKQIAFPVLVGVRARLWRLPHRHSLGASRPVRTGLDNPRRPGRLAAKNRRSGNRRRTPRRHSPGRPDVLTVHQDSTALRRRPNHNEPLAHRIRR